MLQKYWVDKMCEMSEVKTKVDIGHFFLETSWLENDGDVPLVEECPLIFSSMAAIFLNKLF